VASSSVEIFDNILQQPSGGFLMTSNNDAAGATLHDNVYFSDAPDSATTYSLGWFMLAGSAVTMNDWLNTTGEATPTVEEVSFEDSNRTIETYAATLGLGASYEAFMAEALQQSKYNWRPEFTAAVVNPYIRDGFTEN